MNQSCAKQNNEYDINYNKTYKMMIKNQKENLNYSQVSLEEKNIYRTINKCGFNYFTDKKGKCQKCDKYCSVCLSSNSTCIVCEPPYAMSKQFCVNTFSIKINYLKLDLATFNYYNQLQSKNISGFSPYFKIGIFDNEQDDDGDLDEQIYHSNIINARLNQEYIIFKYVLASHWNLMEIDYESTLNNDDEQLNLIGKGKTNSKKINLLETLNLGKNLMDVSIYDNEKRKIGTLNIIIVIHNEEE